MSGLRETIARIVAHHDDPQPWDWDYADEILAIPVLAEALELRRQAGEFRHYDLGNSITVHRD